MYKVINDQKCQMFLHVLQYYDGPHYSALIWQKEASDKSDISREKSNNVSVIYTDVNGISWCLILHIS